jgi:lysophospholipase L1-like esterase
MFLENWPALLAFNPDLTVVFIGGNDFKEFPKQDLAATVQIITQRVALLIDRLREHNPKIRIVVASYHDAYDGLSSAVKAPAQEANTSPAVRQLCDAYELLARQKGCGSVCRKIYDSFMNHCWGQEVGGAVHWEPTYSRPYHPEHSDQHPSPAGQQALAEIFYEEFCQMAGVPVPESQPRVGADRQ